MEVIIAGEQRTWTPHGELAECYECGSRTFRRSKLGKNWYCKGCWTNYGKERPVFPAINCSTHGRQIRQNTAPDAYWCTDCEEDDFQHTYNATNGNR